MKDILVLLVTVLVATAEVMVPMNGYCIGNYCFAAFPYPANFITAYNHCEKNHGNLMTVRSSVSHDTLSILLGRLAGEYWIGLHVPSGCPDAEAHLLGFQWVTGDTDSDFTNWAPTSHNDDCSSTCVSVSRHDDFKWTQESCDRQLNGFLCEFEFATPCKQMVVSAEETVRYMTPYGFEVDDVLSLPPGSTATRHPSETKHICFGETWVKAPWSCEIAEGGCEHKCFEDRQEKEPICVCPTGTEVNPKNNVTCEEVQNDPCILLRCEQACYQKNDAYVCMCDHGFELAEDGRTCRDINDCKDERQCPGDNFKCVNTIGGFQCVCKDGYRLVRDACVDVDECVSAPCEHMCTNTPGGYKCSCFEGYVEAPGSPDKCLLHCGRPECPAECDPNNHLQCKCPNGYIADERGDQVFCVDMNECDMFFCDQLCKNTYGGYICSCRPEYVLVDNYKCEKEDDDKDKDKDTDGWEGSGATTPYFFVTPSIKYPDPTRRPSGVTPGGLLGIIVSVVVVVFVTVFTANHILTRRGKLETGGAPKAQGGEDHVLTHVTTDMSEKSSQERDS